MEIKTTTNQVDAEIADSPPAPDKSRYLRRKPPQPILKSHNALPRLRSALSILGKCGVSVLLAAFLFSIFNYANTSEKFNLRTFTFHGCRQVDSRVLEEMIRQSYPPNILMVDLHKMRSRLEAEPWIKRAEMRRILPSELVFYIQERVPSVIVELRGELMLSDDEGILLDRYDPKYGKLDVPVFKGFMGDNTENYRLYQEENTLRVRLGCRMLAELEAGSPAFTQNISEVDLSDKNNVRILLVDDNAEVFLGDREFLKRIRTLMANLPQYQELKSQYSEIASVDLRFDGQIIYRPRKAPDLPSENSTRVGLTR